MSSLLYTLVRRRLGLQVEPVLTDGLAHLLEHHAVRAAFLGRLLGPVPDLPADLPRVRLRAQGAADDSRPDLVGTVDQRELLLIEGKLWAGLTPAQRGGYAARLAGGARAGSHGAAGSVGMLLFVAPSGRTETLWAQLAGLHQLGPPTRTAPSGTPRPPAGSGSGWSPGPRY